MEANFSEGLQEVIRNSREEAMRLGHDTIQIGHLLLGVLKRNEGIGIEVLKSLNTDLKQLQKSIVKELDTSKVSIQTTNLSVSKTAEKVLKVTYLESKLYKSEKIGSEHLILSILRDEENEASRSLHAQDINYDTFRKELDLFINNDDDTLSSTINRSALKKPKPNTSTKTKTPVLDNFGRDLTRLAAEGK